MNKVSTKIPEAAETVVLCARCDGRTTHKILATVDESGSDYRYDWSQNNQIVQCLGCKTVSFRIVLRQ